MNPTDRMLARRYAKAYINPETHGSKPGDSIQDRLACLEKYKQSLSGAMEIISCPLVPWEEKVTLVRQILGKDVTGTDLKPVDKHEDMKQRSLRLIELLIKGKRFHLIDAIVEESKVLVESRMGLIRAEVRSAVPLGRSVLAKLKAELDRITGKDVIIDIEVTPELIGGLAIRIGDWVGDFSLKSNLRNLRKELFNLTI